MKDISANSDYSDDEYQMAKAIIETAHVQSAILRRIDELETLHRTTLDEIRRWQMQSTDRFIEIMDKRQKEEIERLMAVMKISTANESAMANQKSIESRSNGIQSVSPVKQFSSQQACVVNRATTPYAYFGADIAQNQLINQMLEQQMQQIVANQSRGMAPLYTASPYGVTANFHAGLPPANVLPSTFGPLLTNQTTISCGSNQSTFAPVFSTSQPIISFPSASLSATSIPQPVVASKAPGTVICSTNSSIAFAPSKFSPIKTEHGLAATPQNLTLGSTKSSTVSKDFSNISFNAQTPVHSTLKKPQTPPSTVKSVSGDLHGDDDEAPEYFEPSAHFEPVIPLPDIVEQTTGEEHEIVKFAERCRLYRFVDKEFKERGVGVLKILESPETKICRIVMRREQILKVCANHVIHQAMSLTPLQKSDRAFVWLARDFAEGVESIEKFAVRFKSADIARKFESAFNAARKANNTSGDTDVTTVAVEQPKSFGDAFKPIPGSWTCSACYVTNNASDNACVCCKTTKDGVTVSTQQSNIFASKPTSTVAPLTGSGFSFGFNKSTPPPATTATPVNVSSNKDSPATSFSFSKAETDLGIKSPTSADTSKINVTQVSSSPEITNNQSQNLSIQSAPLTTATTTAPTFSFIPSTKPTTTSAFNSSPQSMPSFSFKTANVEKPNTSPFGGSLMFGSSVFSSFSGKGDSPNVSTTTPPAKTSLFGSSLFGSAKSNKDGENKIGGFAALAASAKTETSPRESSSGKTITPFGGGKFNSGTNSIFSKISSANKSEQKDKAENSDDEDEFVPTADFKPVIPLPELVEVKTGEESEMVVFQSRAKLFRFANKEYKERGVGVLKLLLNNKTNKCRCVMRRDQVLKVCANFPLTEGMKIDKKPNTGNACMWACRDYSENTSGQMECFVAKFKDDALANGFLEAFRKGIANRFTEKDFISKEKESYGSETTQSDCNSKSDSYVDVEKCDSKSKFDAQIKINEAFSSPLRPSKAVEISGSINLFLEDNCMHLSVTDTKGTQQFSHAISEDDSIKTEGTVELKYIAVDEKSESKQLTIDFKIPDDRQKAVELLIEGISLAKENRDE